MEISLRRTAIGAFRPGIARALAAVANLFKPRPDRSLVNVKFTDSLERELVNRESRHW